MEAAGSRIRRPDPSRVEFMVSIVNGYVCFNCTDQEKAQKGIDPANSTNDPTQNKSVLEKKDEAHAIAKVVAAKNGQSASSGGSSSGQASASGQPTPLPALLAPGIGDLLDVTA